MDNASHLMDLMRDQDGVIARFQALELGLAPHDIRRLVRQRRWARVHRGVFVNHTGPLAWKQRAWGAVLCAWPAALAHESAVRAIDGPGRSGRDDDQIHIAVSSHRTSAAIPGVTTHYLSHFDAKVTWNASPPRVRIEEAIVDLAAEANTEFDAITVIANAVQSRRTTAGRIREALRGRARIGRRRFLERLLDDVDEGACSVLEQGYLTRVERAHGLPTASRQVKDSRRGTIYRDVLYEEFGLIVELDGHAFHTGMRDRHRDLDRDLDAALDGHTTVRLGWGQVYGRHCATARRIGALLQRLGWTGALASCPDCDRE